MLWLFPGAPAVDGGVDERHEPRHGEPPPPRAPRGRGDALRYGRAGEAGRRADLPAGSDEAVFRLPLRNRRNDRG